MIPYLSDNNNDAKAEAIDLLGILGGEAAAGALANVLSDKSETVRNLGARRLYRLLSSGTKCGGFESELMKGFGFARPNAAALLLLGYATAGDKILKAYRSKTYLVRLVEQGPEVPAGLPTIMALSRRGDTRARLDFYTEISAGNIKTLVFILQAIEIIDDPGLLHALANVTFKDKREVIGTPANLKPKRRIVDLSVDAFVKRLRLELSFKTIPDRRYIADEAHRLHSLIQETIPQ